MVALSLKQKALFALAFVLAAAAAFFAGATHAFAAAGGAVEHSLALAYYGCF
jgi:hypothetical protein